jgi:hypothetical protein
MLAPWREQDAASEEVYCSARVLLLEYFEDDDKEDEVDG